MRGEGDPRKREGYAEGAFVVQEEGAQAIALALGARPGERMLDACAGRGQKTTLLGEQVGSARRSLGHRPVPEEARSAVTPKSERLRLAHARAARGRLDCRRGRRAG